jgi:hypothetical protein
MNLARGKALVDALFATYARVGPSSGSSVVDPRLLKGKLYEAWILADVLERLRAWEGYTVTLISGGSKLYLRSNGGRIDPAYPHFALTGGYGPDLDVWTDITFNTLGHQLRGGLTTSRADFHELDVVAVRAGTTGRPGPRQLLIGVECKATSFQKHMYRAMLGVRRELSYFYSRGSRTGFYAWPAPRVNARPASALLVYSTSALALEYRAGGSTFGVDFYQDVGP